MLEAPKGLLKRFVILLPILRQILVTAPRSLAEGRLSGNGARAYISRRHASPTGVRLSRACISRRYVSLMGVPFTDMVCNSWRASHGHKHAFYRHASYGRAPHERASHERASSKRASHRRASCRLISVHFIGVHVMGMHVMSVRASHGYAVS